MTNGQSHCQGVLIGQLNSQVIRRGACCMHACKHTQRQAARTWNKQSDYTNEAIRNYQTTGGPIVLHDTAALSPVHAVLADSVARHCSSLTCTCCFGR